jgi:ubiquinone/menaquinone biosynthesis C-methylase UbiE
MTEKIMGTKYDNLGRWNSYWYQIQEVLWTNPRRVLEVGPGHGVVAWYLKRVKKVEVYTADINPLLQPDVVCNVLELSQHFKRDEFDTVLVAEVLEHLPFKFFERALKEIKYVTKKAVVLTLPFSSSFVLRFRVPIINFKMVLALESHKTHEFDGEHYWEIGKRGFPYHVVKEVIEKHFFILKSYNIFENPYHRVIVAIKKKGMNEKY